MLSHLNPSKAEAGLFRLPLKLTLKDFVPVLAGVNGGIVCKTDSLAASLNVFIAEAILVPKVGIKETNFSTDKPAIGPSAVITSFDKEPRISMLESIESILTVPFNRSDICVPDIFTCSSTAFPPESNTLPLR